VAVAAGWLHPLLDGKSVQEEKSHSMIEVRKSGLPPLLWSWHPGKLGQATLTSSMPRYSIVLEALKTKAGGGKSSKEFL
jgi:hypothetical protein